MTASTTKRKRRESGTPRPSDDSATSVPPPGPKHEQDEEGLEARPTKKGKFQTTSPRTSGIPSTSRYLITAMGGNHWHAIDSLQTIMILGDSYSKSNDGGKTWVDHVERRLQQSYEPPQVYNFASPGATAEDDLMDQVSRSLARFSKDSNARLDPERTTYFVFIGTNDCGNNDSDDLETIVESIGDAVHDLYVKAGARNFVLIDVPPINRSPQAIDTEMADEIEERVKTWNELLQAQVSEFGTSSTEATILLFSSHQALTEVLDDPSGFDFGEDDAEIEGGRIWEDDLHLTADVHDILAERLLMSLSQ